MSATTADGTAQDVGTEEFAIGPDEESTALERDVWAALDTVPDPHIPASLVEMAMIYAVDADENGHVTITMTYPCIGCPAYDMIQEDVRACTRVVDGVADVTVEVTWDPVWSKDMLTTEAREELREAGIGL